MWGYHSCEPKNRFILFKYNDSRGGKVASDILKNYTGILQTDGYSGYNELRSRSNVVNVGCWAHCRRHFVDVIKIASIPGKATEIVKLINELYQIEKTARDQNLNFVERKELRQKEAPPILEKIHDALTKANAPPKSSLGKAITYALNQWPHLKKYVDHGEAEIDNNLIENQIRPFALGRRNWLFLGNERAANTAAFFCSILQTCRINNIDARKYLIYVLSQVGNMRRGRIDPKILLPQFIGTIPPA
jgi:transposase